MATANRLYKDRLFCKLFGDPEHKDSLLSLFNALNGTSYDNPDDLEINTLEDSLWLGMKNDVSCIIEEYMTLFEQQASVNKNMPTRGLMYFSKLLENYFQGDSARLYSRNVVKIPAPKYFVLYNGIEEVPDVEKLRLSDAFMIEDKSGDFEWTATVININPGHNEKILEACKMLKDYSLLVAKINELRYDKGNLENAVKTAVEYCIENDVLSEYLSKHKAEVIGMILADYDAEAVKQVIADESREEGRAEGLAEGLAEGRSETEQRYEKLIMLLDRDGRLQDVVKITKSADYKEQLFKEYGL